MRLNSFGWFTMFCLSMGLVAGVAGCGSVGAPKPSVEFKVNVPIKTLHKQNFAWGECPPKYHNECTATDENGECTADTCVADPDPGP